MPEMIRHNVSVASTNQKVGGTWTRRRVIKYGLALMLVAAIWYVSSLIYFVYFWDGGWGKSIVEIMYSIVGR